MVGAAGKVSEEEERGRETCAGGGGLVWVVFPSLFFVMAKKDKSSKGKSKNDGVKAEVLAMQEEEGRRARREVNLARLKSRQEREERYTVVNQVKIHNQWRKVMRLAKVDELRREVQIISQNHEREVDRKDSIIQMLDRDLEDAEEQYQMAHRAHLMVMDSLLDLQHNRLRALECELDIQVCTHQNG